MHYETNNYNYLLNMVTANNFVNIILIKIVFIFMEIINKVKKVKFFP